MLIAQNHYQVDRKTVGGMDGNPANYKKVKAEEADRGIKKAAFYSGF